MKCAILAAGLGQRLQELTPHKPLLEIGGKTLLEHSISRLNLINPESITILFNSSGKEIELPKQLGTNNSNISCYYKDTPSSLHTLYELSKRVKININEHLLVTMVDTLINDTDFLLFANYSINNLTKNESCIMATPYIEDEKPLTIRVDQELNILEFQSPLSESKYVTSGIYCFSYSDLQKIKYCVDKKMIKMRNFLKEALNTGSQMKSFIVKKTMDVDRIEDIESAEQFLSCKN